MKVSIFKTINWIKVRKIKRTDDRYKWSKWSWPFNNSLYKILGGNFLPQFLHTTELGSGCLGNWTQSKNKHRHQHHRSVLPYRKTVSHEKINRHYIPSFCYSFIIIPKFTKNKILYIYYIQFHCQNIMHQTSS